MGEYIKVFCDMSETVDELSDAEAGRLFKALLHYGGKLQTVDQLPGQEKLIFKILKAQIDRDREAFKRKANAVRENGKLGGRPPKNLKKPTETKENLKKPKKPTWFSENQNSQDKDINNIPPYNPPTGGEGDDGDGFASPEELSAIQQQHDTVFAAALRAGFPDNSATLDRLARLIGEHGADAVVAALDECVDSCAPNFRYLSAVLKNAGKRQEAEDRFRDRYNGYEFL